MEHMGWLSAEAHRIHDWFVSFFYALMVVFILMGTVMEYFKLPLGISPSIGPLVGRALIAALLLHAYPEISNSLADVMDAVSKQLGNFNQFETALHKMGDKVNELSWSWVSVKESVIAIICYLCFFLFYFSVHVVQAVYLYTLVLLYVFSPVLIALFVLPQTAGATSALFRSLIEASLWKPVWCVLATLLWSTGISEIQAEGSEVSFLSAICFCLLAAGSLIVTPILVHMLAEKGVAGMAKNISEVAIPGVGTITAGRTIRSAMDLGKRGTNASLELSEWATKKPFPRVNRILEKIPRLEVHNRSPLLRTPEKPVAPQYPNKITIERIVTMKPETRKDKV